MVKAALDFPTTRQLYIHAIGSPRKIENDQGSSSNGN
jgi:hypothetical protein